MAEIRINPDDYPANKPVERRRVVTSEVKAPKKRGFLSRVKDTILPDDVDDVATYIVCDFIIPGLRDFAWNVGRDLLESFTIGCGTGRGYSSSYGRSSYGRSRDYGSYYRSQSQRRSNRVSGSNDFQEYILSSREEAEDVLDEMMEILDHEMFVSIADYYDIIGVKSSGFTDNNFGWENLSSARVGRARDGYILNLPRTVRK